MTEKKASSHLNLKLKLTVKRRERSHQKSKASQTKIETREAYSLRTSITVRTMPSSESTSSSVEI